MFIQNPNNEHIYSTQVKYDSGCDCSGAMTYKSLEDIKTALNYEPTIHKLEYQVDLYLANDQQADNPTEYVILPILLPFQHGKISTNLKFLLLTTKHEYATEALDQ